MKPTTRTATAKATSRPAPARATRAPTATRGRKTARVDTIAAMNARRR